MKNVPKSKIVKTIVKKEYKYIPNKSLPVNYNNGTIKRVHYYAGETIETVVERVSRNKEAIKGTNPPIGQTEKYFIDPSCDCRTDRFAIAVDAMDIANKSRFAKRTGDRDTGKVEKANPSDPDVNATE